jgi:hypothetical protein
MHAKRYEWNEKREREKMNEPEIYLKMKNLENEKERKEMLLIMN